MRDLIGILMLLLLAGFLLGRGVWMLKGGGKGWYFATHIYAGFIYAQIPLGITCLCFAIVGIFQLELLFVKIGVVIGILGIIFNFIQPSFLKPGWLRWLEREHGDIMPYLAGDAHARGLDEWQAQMQTEEDIEAWAEEVRRKVVRVRGAVDHEEGEKEERGERD